jgi:MFS transporter, ACS family, D-galactonate transporter
MPFAFPPESSSPSPEYPPLLKDELHISVTQLSMLLSAFFWTYTAMQFVSGWLVDRFKVNWVMATGFLVWSLATSAQLVS